MSFPHQMASRTRNTHSFVQPQSRHYAKDKIDWDYWVKKTTDEAPKSEDLLFNSLLETITNADKQKKKKTATTEDSNKSLDFTGVLGATKKQQSETQQAVQGSSKEEEEEGEDYIDTLDEEDYLEDNENENNEDYLTGGEDLNYLHVSPDEPLPSRIESDEDIVAQVVRLERIKNSLTHDINTLDPIFAKMNEKLRTKEEMKNPLDSISIEDQLVRIASLASGKMDQERKEIIKETVENSEKKQKIVDEVNELFTKLSKEDFDKLFYEAQTEHANLTELKSKMIDMNKKRSEQERLMAQLMHRLEPDSLSTTTNEEYRTILNSLLDNSLSFENLRDSVREAKSEYSRLSAKERKNNMLLTSFKYYTQQRDLDFEKMKNERSFAKLVKNYDELNNQAPDEYKDQVMQLYAKTLPSGSLDKIMDRIVAGDSIPEVKRYFDSITYPILAKPEYEFDEYEYMREEAQNYLDKEQQHLMAYQGIKQGRRRTSPVAFSSIHTDEAAMRYLARYDPELLPKSPALHSLKNLQAFCTEFIQADTLEGHSDRKKLRYKYARSYLTRSEREKKVARREKRRFNIFRLENTIRAFSWVRKYKPRFFA